MKRIYFVLSCCLVLLLSSNAYATLITSSSDAALSGAQVIDFESEALGNFDSLSVGIVNFIATPGAWTVSNSYSGRYGMTGQHLDNTRGNDNNLTITFNEAVDAFGFDWGAANVNWTMSAYDSQDTLLETVTLAYNTIPLYHQFYGIAHAGISRVELNNTEGSDWILMDNFHVKGGGDPIPEPATVLLFGAGLLGLAGISRKKRLS